MVLEIERTLPWTEMMENGYKDDNRALQAKTIYSWEYMSPDGLALNSKWNKAEKYICNPLSGEVPLECLSAKTLSGRSFLNRITMFAPLIYPCQLKPHLLPAQIQVPSKDIEKKGSSSTRDVGTQSGTPAYLSSKIPSPTRTPSIEERKHRQADADESPAIPINTTPKSKPEQQE